MSDIVSSGAGSPAAETVNPPSAPVSPNPNPTPGTFGNNRGSGLARGKRPSAQSSQAPSAAPAADYKPTAVAILTAPTEYKNPFAPPAPAEVPAVETEIPAPSAPPAAEAAAPAIPVEAAPPARPEPARAEVSEPAQAAPSEPEPKAELKILPPETPKRVEHSWESRSFRNVASQPGGEPPRPADSQAPGMRPRRDERPVFRPDRERRFDRPNDLRSPAGEPDRSDRAEVGRPDAVPPTPPAEPKKSGGLFAWVKKIFGGSPAAAQPPATEGRGEGDPGRPGGYRRRRHRGGRGRNFRGDQQGPRDGQSGGQDSGEPRGQFSGDSRGQGGDRRYQGQGQGQGQRRRRRHRGGGGGEGFRGNGRPDSGPPSGS